MRMKTVKDSYFIYFVFYNRSDMFAPYFIRAMCGDLQVQNNVSLDRCHCISPHQGMKDLNI